MQGSVQYLPKRGHTQNDCFKGVDKIEAKKAKIKAINRRVKATKQFELEDERTTVKWSSSSSSSEDEVQVIEHITWKVARMPNVRTKIVDSTRVSGPRFTSRIF